MTPTELHIDHDASAHRFVAIVDGVQAHLEYRLGNGVVTITHTIVPEAIGGRGIAGALVRTAMDFARAEGLKIDPVCSYSAAWMQRNPDYADLHV